jgi:hypothetical protein
MKSFLDSFNGTIPLFFPAVSLCCGIVLFWGTFEFGIHIPIVYCIALTGLFCFSRPIFSQKDRSHYNTLFCAFLFCTGFFLAQRQHLQFTSTSQLFLNRTCALEGIVQDIEYESTQALPYCLTITLDRYQINKDKWKSIQNTVKIRVRFVRWITVGDKIRVTGITGSQATGNFLQYLLKEDILLYLFAPSAKIRKIKENAAPMRLALSERMNTIHTFITVQGKKQTRLFFDLLFLGKKHPHDSDAHHINSLFQQWGISHMLARSGMHLTIFVSLCVLLLQLIPVSFTLKQIFIAFLCIVYALLSYSSTSFARALISAFLLLYCHSMRARTNFLHVTLLTLIFHLLINPIQLLFLDFQLSYGLTLTLGVLTQRIKN